MEILEPFIKQFASSLTQYTRCPEIHQWMCDMNQSPEDILHLVSSLLYSISVNSDEHRANLQNSVAVMLLETIVYRDPSVIVGAWEDVLDLVIKYSGKFRDIKYIIPNNKINENHKDWMQQVLGSHVKCPNPVLRLEMMRLLDIFWPTHDNDHYIKTGLFDAVLEIDLDIVAACHNLMIGSPEIRNTLHMLHRLGYMATMSSRITIQLNENNGDDKELQFLGKLIQLTGMLALKATSNCAHGGVIQCITLLGITVNMFLVNAEGVGRREHLQHSLLQPYIRRALRDISEAALRHDDVRHMALIWRDRLVASMALEPTSHLLPHSMIQRELGWPNRGAKTQFNMACYMLPKMTLDTHTQMRAQKNTAMRSVSPA